MKHTIETELEKLDAARLSELGNGRKGVRGTLAITSSKAAGDGPVLDFVASDDTLDRYDEIIDANGWRLENYRRNPVFQNSHRYGDVLCTIGKSLITEVHDGKLYQRVEFAVDANPIAKVAYALYMGQFLNAVSVGFIPMRWINGGADDPFRRKYLEQELLELSAVSIPANPNALALGYKAGAVSKDDLADLYEFLKQFCSNQKELQAGLDSNARAPGIETHGAQLLQLAREARAVLAA